VRSLAVKRIGMLSLLTATLLAWHAPLSQVSSEGATHSEAVPSNVISIEPAHPVPDEGTVESEPAIPIPEEVSSEPASGAHPDETVTAPQPVSPELPDAPIVPMQDLTPVESLREPVPSADTPVAPPEDVVDTESHSAPPPAPEALSDAAPQEEAPDEAALWELYDEGRYSEVLSAIVELRDKHPKWQPPSDLLALTENAMLRMAVRRAVGSSDHAGLIQIAERNREKFSCVRVDWAWSLAGAYAALGQERELFDLLAQLIAECRERERLGTLQKATQWLGTEAWEQLADLESVKLRTAPVDAEYQRLRYDQDVRQLLAAKERDDAEVFFSQLEQMAAAIETYQDAPIGLLAGWSYLGRQHTVNATYWFEKVGVWVPADSDHTRGLALCALAERRYADARRLAESMPEKGEGRQAILRDALIGMAQAQYEQGNYAATLQLFEEAGPPEELPQYARLTQAWSLLQLDEPVPALALFEEAHRRQPDEESAQGIFNSRIRLGRLGTDDAVAEDEFLAPLIREHRAAQAFSKKRFLSARRLAPVRYATAGGAGAPRAAWYFTLRDKSGSEGLSQLEDTIHSLEAVWPASSRSELRLRLDRHDLDAGRFGAAARLFVAQSLLTGALDLASTLPEFAALTKTGAEQLLIDGAGDDVTAWEPHLNWYGEYRFDVEVDIGLSVLGGAVDPRLVGHLSLRDSHDWGEYTVSAYARPIRESVLAYAGWQLEQFVPVTAFNGEKWGGVRRLGAEASAYLALPRRFGFNAKVGVEQIDAENVRRNSHEFLNAGLNRNLDFDAFEYVAAGISAAYDHYEHNLSQFTPGHGGYFSPQRFWQLKANLDFLTLENQTAILKGHVDAGRVYKREADTPIIPLDGFRQFGSFPGDRDWGWAYTIDIEGSLQVGSQVQLGAHFIRMESPRFDETAGMLFVRVLFEPRRSVLSTDLPGAVMRAVR